VKLAGTVVDVKEEAACLVLEVRAPEGARPGRFTVRVAKGHDINFGDSVRVGNREAYWLAADFGGAAALPLFGVSYPEPPAEEG
jgi:hypothetical protein